jgi:hypothetical protein
MPTPSVFVMASMGGDLNNKDTAPYHAGSALTYAVLNPTSRGLHGRWFSAVSRRV